MKTKKPPLLKKLELLEPIPAFGEWRYLVIRLNELVERVNELSRRENERHRP